MSWLSLAVSLLLAVSQGALQVTGQSNITASEVTNITEVKGYGNVTVQVTQHANVTKNLVEEFKDTTLVTTSEEDWDEEDALRDPGVFTERVPWWRRRPYPLRQSAGRACRCIDYTCGCCAGIELQRLNISQRGCLNLKYDPDEFSLELEMRMNDRELVRRSVSARNPSPLCIPLPIPVSFLPGVEFCARVFDVFTPGRNFHMCMDFTTKISQSPVLIMEFDCFRVGLDGFAFLKPEDGGGLPSGGDYGGGGGGGIAGGEVGAPGIESPDGDYDELEPDEPGKRKPGKPTSTAVPAKTP